MAIPKSSDPQVNIRIPRGLKEKIDSDAKKNNRSKNAEIVFLIEKALSAANTQGF